MDGTHQLKPYILAGVAEQVKSLDLLVERCLGKLGISSLGQWDVLVFLYRHQLSLGSSDQVARLLGYPQQEIDEALNTLESLGLVHRSRVLRGLQLYQWGHPEALPIPAFRELMTLAENRKGRLLLAKKLGRGAG